MFHFFSNLFGLLSVQVSDAGAVRAKCASLLADALAGGEVENDKQTAETGDLPCGPEKSFLLCLATILQFFCEPFAESWVFNGFQLVRC
jgi:hypothetical protein